MLRKNIFGFLQRLENNTNTISCILYQSWIVRFETWRRCIESLYLAAQSYVSILFLIAFIIYLRTVHLMECLCFL